MWESCSHMACFCLERHTVTDLAKHVTHEDMKFILIKFATYKIQCFIQYLCIQDVINIFHSGFYYHWIYFAVDYICVTSNDNFWEIHKGFLHTDTNWHTACYLLLFISLSFFLLWHYIHLTCLCLRAHLPATHANIPKTETGIKTYSTVATKHI